MRVIAVCTIVNDLCYSLCSCGWEQHGPGYRQFRTTAEYENSDTVPQVTSKRVSRCGTVCIVQEAGVGGFVVGEV